MDESKAFAVKVGDRFFWRTSKGRILTAWHLAGAKLFMFSAHAIRTAEEISIKRNECVQVAEVRVIGKGRAK